MKFMVFLVSFACLASLANAQIFSSFNIKFCYFGGNETYGKRNLTLLRVNSKFDTSKQTVLYFYRKLQSPESKMVQWVRDAYINLGYNFLLFDLNFVDYSRVSLEKITDQLASAFVPLFTLGLDINKFEIVAVGHGAQFAGLMGRKIKSNSYGAFTVSKIVAIEPERIKNDQLATTDANFVMAIYTEDFISDPDVESHVSFYVNGGVNQPRCGDNFLLFLFNKMCAFKSAQFYWLEAVESKLSTVFPARKCNNYDDFKSNACSVIDPIGYMNPSASILLRGKYYLNTNDEKPFSKLTADP